MRYIVWDISQNPKKYVIIEVKFAIYRTLKGEKMTCMFLGHRDAPDFIKEILYKEICMLIENEGVKKFYVGNNGNYDFLVQRVLEKISKERSDIEFFIVLSYPGERALSNNQEETFFPQGLEKALPKYAISKRNEWLINNSDYAVVFFNHRFSNCARWVEKAEKKGLKIINVAN